MFSNEPAVAPSRSDFLLFRALQTCLVRGMCLLCFINVTVLADDPASQDGATVLVAADQGAEIYQRDVLPVLQQYCFGCHADGTAEGAFTLDEHPSYQDRVSDRSMWWAVLKNVRADVMPPAGEEQPTDTEKQILFEWVTRYSFGSGSGQLDPGKNALRRLNRLEYRNTIRDLMAIDYDTSVEFPPDDSGDGFDNNADALSISPLLAEKYLDAAREIVERSVPQHSRVIPVQAISPGDFKLDGTSDPQSRRITFDQSVTAIHRFKIEHDASYRLVLPIEINGSFDFNSDRARVRVMLDDDVLHDQEHGWKTNFVTNIQWETELHPGDHQLRIVVEPAEMAETAGLQSSSDTYVRLDLPSVRIEGPLDESYWNQTPGYSRFFHLDQPPVDVDEQANYAAEILRRFCRRAYRRPVETAHLGRLLELAGLTKSALLSEPVSLSASASSSPRQDQTFEQRISRAMTAVLASPRFLFRIDHPDPESSDEFPLVDDFTLASRLSYFLWSTMPDEPLMELADRGELRTSLDDQVARMISSDRADTMIDSFVGQWLQTRDVESVSIDPLAALGLRDEYESLSDYLESTASGRREPAADATPEHVAAYKRYREIRDQRGSIDGELRRDMRRETEELFSYVMRDHRSLIELIQSDYAFLNERLAKHYGIDGIDGNAIRQVPLPPDSPFGGVLTQGTFLLVTSNPTRTSPVKRGLFILDNILGTPAPPAPAAVPELEASAQQSTVEKPSLRQLLELHRSEALCRSCHARFDPLGLAFENFSAIGTWRDSDNGQAIEPGGTLISGETFQSVTELKQVLAGPRQRDFYRCLAQRMLSYAVGRSLDFGDEITVEQIVHQLEAQQGRSSALVEGVVQSTAMQRMQRVRQE